MHNIKVIVCDLDGTLLDDQKRISKYDRDMLIEAKKAGIKICFASGRFDQMMSIYVDEIGGCDYVLSSNGAVLYNSNKDKIIHSVVMDEQEVLNILEYLEENDTDFTMYSVDNAYYRKDVSKLKKRFTDYEKLSKELGYPKIINAKGIEPSDFDTSNKDIIKIVAYEKNERKIAVLDEFINSFENLYTESTGYGIEGIFPRTVSKKKALEKLIEDMNITSDNVCAFGDYDNDISLFECAKHRVAVENAVDELKDMATYITASNNDSGVGRFISKILEKTN